MTPLVSVILVTYNTRDLLARCLESLPAALEGIPYEVWVVDNASTDDTIPWLRAQHPEVHVLANPTNRGFAAANNQAMAQARGRYFLLLNTDTLPQPGSLAALVDYLEHHPEVGIAGSSLLNPDGTPQGCAADFPTLGTELLLLLGPIGHRLLGSHFPFHPPAEAPRRVDWVSGACLLIRREVVEAIGGLDEGYFVYGEEVDWCWRAWQAGWEVAVVPQARVIHLGSATARRMDGLRRRWLYAGKARFLRKARGPLTASVYRAAVWGTTLLKWIGMRLIGRREQAAAYGTAIGLEGWQRWAQIFFTPIAWTLFLLIFLSTVYVFPRWADWNQNSRLDLVLALVEQGTFRIDAFVENTGDYAMVGGHYYSDKAPGLAFAAVPLYALLHPILVAPLAEPLSRVLERSPAFRATLNPAGTGVSPWKVRFAIAQVILSAVVVALPSAAIAFGLHGFLHARFGDHPVTWIIPLAYGLATPAFAYANLFVAHQFVAALLMTAFALAWGIRRGFLGEGWMVPLGFLLAYAFISEYPTILIGGAIAVYGLGGWREGISPLARRALKMGAGGIPPLLLAAWHNTVVFGSPFELGYAYSTLWQEVHRQGFFSLRGPSSEALWGITFSPYRGLFFRSPFLLLGLIGLWWMLQDPEWRAEGRLGAWAALSFMAFNASSAMWDGGFAVGPRYLLPMVPFLALGAGFAIPALARHRMGWGGIGLLWLWSLGMVMLESLAGQQFPQYQRFPLVEYVWPRWQAGDIARNWGVLLGLRGIPSLLPLMALWGWGLWRLLPRAERWRIAVHRIPGGNG
ncbi:MAG: glycosyltransferase family 2 protein [Anaerolineae bacterium]|nr:glycosyltransferase family 2 protein [Anaerolineae bacterium]